MAGAECVVVVPVVRLLKLEDVETRRVNEFAHDNWADDEDQEQEEHEEVENGVTDDATLAKLRLLQRIDRRTDLTAMTTVRLTSE